MSNQPYIRNSVKMFVGDKIKTAGVKALLCIPPLLYRLLEFRNQSGCTNVKENDDMEGIGIFMQYFVAAPQLDDRRFLEGEQLYYGRPVDDRS